MNAFLIALQFLTRIKLVRQTVWTEKDFGASVTWFPAVGAIIGLLLCGIYWLLHDVVSPFAVAVILVIAEFLITGGLHADGLMDTCDGYFSGRSRERMLEIMKDSRVGANGVQAFVFFVLLKIALLLSLSVEPYVVLGTMPLLGRWLMSWSVTGFPYARPQGIGKAFAEYAPPYALKVATLIALIPVLWVPTPLYLTMAGTAVLWGWWANSRLVRKLGGVTGDTYGAVTETGELMVLAAGVAMGQWAWNMW